MHLKHCFNLNTKSPLEVRSQNGYWRRLCFRIQIANLHTETRLIHTYIHAYVHTYSDIHSPHVYVYAFIYIYTYTYLSLFRCVTYKYFGTPRPQVGPAAGRSES